MQNEKEIDEISPVLLPVVVVVVEFPTTLLPIENKRERDESAQQSPFQQEATTLTFLC